MIDHACKTRTIVPLAALALVACFGSIGQARAEQSFQALRDAASQSLATQPESAILALLDAGLAEDKPTQAVAIAQRWLRDNIAEDPMLLYKAGRAAELSGDWRAAATLYQQFLQRADLKSQAAADAILGVYTLLIDQLADSESAYVYAKTDGHRLVGSAQARQFDRWFLDQAVGRGDAEAVADRLLALVEAGVGDDLLVAHYDRFFRWLLHNIDGRRLDNNRLSDEFVATVKSLADKLTYDVELKLLLDWEVSVKAYNMNMLDGRTTDPPVAEAKALLAKFPLHALGVQTDWAGGSRSRHYREDRSKYWPADLEAKMQPVRAAVAKLSDVDRAIYYESWNADYYDGGPVVVDAAQAIEFVLANPKLANSKSGPPLSFNWTKLTSEQIEQLAPLLERNPTPEAAVIRAMAAAGEDKDYDKAIDALLTDESWRLSRRELDGHYADRLWHWAGRPGGNAKRDQAIKRSKQLAKQIQVGDAKQNDPAGKRMAAFKKLWSDYRSAKPKLPGVYERLVRVVRITPEALPDLLGDSSAESELLLRDALAAGVSGNGKGWDAYESARSISTGRYSPCFDELVRRHYGGLSRLVNDEAKYRAHPLEALFRQRLADQIKQGKVESWLVFAWLNTQFPEDNAESIALIERLIQSPAWKSLPYEARFGARRWFGTPAMTPAQTAIVQAADPAMIFEDLRTLAEDADAATTASVLSKTLDAMSRSPIRVDVQGLGRLEKLSGEVFTDPKVFDLIVELVRPMRSFETSSGFGERLFGIVNQRRDAELTHETAAYLWRHTEVHHRTLERLIDFADSLTETQPSAAQTLARCGLQTFDRYTRGHHYFNNDRDIPRLRSIRGKATLAMGLIDIPVPKSHPAYGIYRSQAEFAIGNEGSARELYAEHADALLPIHRKLSVSYLLWVLQYTIDQRNELQQEALAKALMTWMAESPGAFSLDQRVALEIAYGDIALQRGLLPEALKIFARIRAKKEYEPVYARHTASLRQVLVQRISGDYDGALQTLLEIEAEKIPRLTTQAHYARAEVFYAMEEFEDARDEVAKVLERDPDHADATILRGRIQLKLQKLIEATEVEIGSATDQATLVPGEMLKVTLNDPTLSVSSGASDIEVVVWATSGDREHVLLRQFGDEKTKYRGEVKTALGKPSPDDRTLQIIGDDEIYYAYSERFRAKMPNLEENRGGPITVASDAIMMASARQLLSESEQRVADMEAATRLLETQYRNMAENIDPEKLERIKAEAAERQRRAMLEARVKPGNPIYLRVIDPDRGRTAEVDELAVSVSASSGDVVGRVVLRETETHSGRFEGQLQTVEAQAKAYGSSSETGRNPNMVISPKTDYPAWRPVPSNGDMPSFTVDLNDNAAIKTLRIDASDDGYALKRFLVQTAMNRQAWTTVASYPAARMTVADPWKPSVTVVNEEGRRAHYGARSVYELRDLEQYMQAGWLAAPDMALAMNVPGPSQALPEKVLSEVKWLRSGRWPNPGVMVRFRAYFYEPVRVQRKFALKLGKHQIKAKDKNQQQEPEFLIAVDGRVITSKADGRLAGEIDLRPGLHRVEIWATGWIENIGFGRSVTLQANMDEPETLVDCPDSFFDPTAFPADVLEHRNGPAKISPNQAGTAFDVAFGPGSKARLLRIVFVDQQGPVPSLNRLTLASEEGKSLLPVQQDYADQRKNDTLEILTGDRITVRYVDDRFVTKGKQKHERFLNVAYTDGEVEFADIEPRYSSRHGKDMPYYEQLLRFVYDKPLSIVIDDADMDVSVEPDRVTCVVTNGTGEQREVVAEETGPSTGRFKAWITPVAAPTDEAAKIQVGAGGELTVTYRDAENLKPGVPYDRVASIRHAAFAEPKIMIAHMTVGPYEPDEAEGDRPKYPTEALNERFDPPHIAMRDERRDDYQDRIARRYLITQRFLPVDQAPSGGFKLVHGRHALIDVLAPQLALGAASTLELYVQTEAGRAAAGVTDDATFDPDVPGTMRFTGQLDSGARSQTPQRGGYVTTFQGHRASDYERAAISRKTGRFRFTVPLIAGPEPQESFADAQWVREQKLAVPSGVVARAGQRVFIGVPYTDEQGNRVWATATAKIITQPMLDVMQDDYRATRDEVHVGEKLYLRVVDTAQDRTAERDQVRVYIASKSGRRHYMLLGETDTNSGIFKGFCQLTYATGDESDEDEEYDVRIDGFPVVYGDAVGIRYTDRSGTDTPVHYVTIAKGSDGTIAPFSKRYDDPEMAMRTQFAMAEGYLELARRHRKLGQADLAERQFLRAKQLLANVVTQFDDPETRSHAEYLLGNLTLEDAEITEDPEMREDRYHAALARFMKITGTYPDTTHASRAQFKIAVIYEELGEADIAAQEYVKLAYKYPDSEHLATAMARLGTHFQRKAVGLERESVALLEQTDDQDKLFEGEATRRMANLEYVKAAQIFERLQSRFPDHDLAGKAGLRAGKIYMRAEQYTDAIHALRSIVDNESYDGATLRSEAMYWAGRCHESLRQQLLAYALFKRITYDFPESKWAAYARARLSTERMIDLDYRLERERLEEGR